MKEMIVGALIMMALICGYNKMQENNRRNVAIENVCHARLIEAGITDSRLYGTMFDYCVKQAK